MNTLQLQRRQFLSMGIKGAALFAAGGLVGCGSSASNSPFHSLAAIGELQPPDDNGIMLPAGFTSRIVARSSSPPLPGSSYIWHPAPDGGACFATADGGWVYVSNSEVWEPRGRGGVGALRFNSGGELTDAYPILRGTTGNCAGGATPWGTWLSCEEYDGGLVHECDPLGQRPAQVRPALGRFQHEAVAVDERNQCLYLTEDKPDGGFYRFRAASLPGLEQGVLEIAVRETRGGRDYLNWLEVPDPELAFTETPTRHQVAGYAPFAGGEGIAYYEGALYFVTKHDNRVWRYAVRDSRLDIIYDPTVAPAPILSGVDNVAITPTGDVLICEDGGDMQIVVITPDRRTVPLLQLTGQDRSEIAGAAFDPSYQRLYFSSQRGITGASEAGITYEISRA